MYLSDYLYASGYFSNASTATYTLYFGNKNWLYKGDEWLLTPSDSKADFVWYVNLGSLRNYSAITPNSARPTFYLKSSVYVTGGDGTFANPYIIE